MNELTVALAEGGGVILRRNWAGSPAVLDRALATGLIQKLASGAYAPAGEVTTELRAAAVLALEPAAVITGHAAAALSWWPELKVPQVGAACGARRRDGYGITWERRIVPPELIIHHGGCRVTAPALTVLDLIPTLGGTAIDEALRRGAVSLAALNATLQGWPRRRGDLLRRTLLVDSRDEPWSEAERDLHRRYRSLALPYAYATNHEVMLPDGTRRFLDLALPELLLGFEVDGFRYHSSREAFQHDRRSDAALATLSWHRVRLDADFVLDGGDEVTATMLAVVRAREALFRGTRPPGTRVRAQK